MKTKSRPARWGEAVSKAQEALAAIDAAYGDLETALQDLTAVREEYEEWRDNLPENLQASAIGEKLNEIADMEIPDDPRDQTYADLEELIGIAESVDLPRGFGRD